MEHIENMERELHQKYLNATQTEEHLRDLQEQFLAFRDEKRERESDLRAEIDRLRANESSYLKDFQSEL